MPQTLTKFFSKSPQKRKPAPESSPSAPAVATKKPRHSPTAKKTATAKVPSKTPKKQAAKPNAGKANPAKATSSNVASTLPRIHDKLTVKDLREEAECRGIDKQRLPKLKKDLLHYLVEGSIHLKETQQWKAVKLLKLQIESERNQLHEQSMKQRWERERKAEERREVKKAKERQAMQENRKKEVEKQKSLHTHSFPRVHPHLLAKSSELQFNGKSRDVTARCEYCGNDDDDWHDPNPVLYTCESCDFDICADCFKERNMTPQEKARARELERQRQEQLRKEQLAWRKQQEKEEREQERLWDATKQFKKAIRHPPAKNKTVQGNSLKGYTVWSSDGYDPDGWHSYQGPPDKEFDSTWKNVTDANARARYLFYWENSWGLPARDIDHCGEEPVDESAVDGLKTYTLAPPDSTRWTVGVVPDAAFKHLAGASVSETVADDGCDGSDCIFF